MLVYFIVRSDSIEHSQHVMISIRGAKRDTIYLNVEVIPSDLWLCIMRRETFKTPPSVALTLFFLNF